jgi:hypothetical protein
LNYGSSTLLSSFYCEELFIYKKFQLLFITVHTSANTHTADLDEGVAYPLQQQAVRRRAACRDCCRPPVLCRRFISGRNPAAAAGDLSVKPLLKYRTPHGHSPKSAGIA